VVDGLGTSAVSQDCAKDAPLVILDSNTESCGYHNVSELSSALKLIELFSGVPDTSRGFSELQRGR